MPSAHPWLTDETLREWRGILELLDHPEEHADLSPTLLDAIRRNRMEALAHQRYAGCKMALPALAAETLKAVHYSRRYFFEKYRQLAPEVQARLSEAGISTLFVKGLVVATWFYDPPYCRPFSDLDVIVPYEALERSASILEAMGFEALHRRDMSRREREYIHALAFIHRGDSNLGVELHHNLGIFSFRPGWYMEETCRIRSPHDGLPTLDLEAHVLFLCAHLYYRHYTEAHLLWLHDIHEGVTRHRGRFDWERFRHLAVLAGWGRGVSRVLSALKIYRDWSYPPACRGLEDSPSVRELVHLPREKLALFFAMGGNIPSWRGKLAFVLFHLCPPKAVMVQRYGIRQPSLWFLYYPFRWGSIAAQAARWSLRRLTKGGRSA